MKTENEVVNRWFREVGCGANDPLYLNIEADRAYISDGAGEVATLMTDWDQLCEAANVAELAEILQRDLDESYSASDEG